MSGTGRCRRAVRPAAQHCAHPPAPRPTRRPQTAMATAKYRAAASVCPGYASAHYNLGIVLAEAGDVGEAICAYNTALRHCPAYPEAHNNLGVIYKNLGRLPEAVEAYRRCLQINPNIQLASQNLALALSDLGTEAPPPPPACERAQLALQMAASPSSVRWSCAAYGVLCGRERGTVTIRRPKCGGGIQCGRERVPHMDTCGLCGFNTPGCGWPPAHRL
jgi:tetratricopeptide (TPR) repeat protein